MSGARLELPGYSCYIEADSGVLDVLEQFYPRSLTATHHPKPTEETFAIVHSGSGWELQRDGEPTGTFQTVGYAALALENQVETEVTAADSGLLALHAGAVATSRGAWLIAGDPDSGKTSSTFQCLQLGQGFLCEEVALYDPGSHTVTPYPQTLALEARFVERFERHFPVVNGRLWPLDSTIVRFVPEKAPTEPVGVDSLLLPRYSPGKAPRVESLTPPDVLTELLGYCFEPTATGEEYLFDAMIALLSKTRVLRLTYGDLRAAREIYRSLLADPGGVGGTPGR